MTGAYIQWVSLVFSIVISSTAGNAPDNRGTEFIVGFMANYQLQRPVEVFVTTSRTTQVSVQVTAPKYSSVNLNENFEVTAGEVKQIFISNTIRSVGTEKNTKSIYVTASDEVVVYGANKEDYSNDAFLGLPLDVIGDEYYAVSHHPSEMSCELLVIAAEDATTITIRYADNSGISVYYNGVTYRNGDTQTITLDKFETFQAQTQGDLTGTYVTGNKNFVFFSGNKLTNVNPVYINGGTRDTLVEQLLPVKTWGKEFGYVATPARTTGDEMRILGSEDNTNVELECSNGFTDTFTIDAGGFHQSVTPSSQVCHVIADKPILVILIVISQLYSNEPADPAIITIPPFEQYAADYTFATPQYTQGSYTNYFMFIVKNDEKDGLRWNGNAFPSSTAYTTIPGTNYVAGYISINEGTHSIRHTSPIALFSGFIYGSAYAESYGMPTGLRLAPINAPCTPSVSVVGDGLDNDCDGRIDEERCIGNGSNVALGKPCAFSSVYSSSKDWGPEKAVDGHVYGGDIYTDTCFHTLREYEPWFRIDLERDTYLVNSVVISNRLDCCDTRANNIKLSLGTTLNNLAQAGYLTGPLATNHTFTVSPVVQARYVHLTLSGITEYFHLCEVEVYADSDDDSDGTLNEDCAKPVPIDGGWGSWSVWSSVCYCANGGQKPRTRPCDNPVPQYDGAQCVGDATSYTTCTPPSACPVDGGYSSWSSWGSCSATCGTAAGDSPRTRTCTNPSPANGGANCSSAGDDTQTQVCFSSGGACPVNGGYSDWSAWGACSVTCGSGVLTKTRGCTNPAPAHGGVDCSGLGSDSDTTSCFPVNCPIDGGYGDWSAWSSCSVTCATGTVTRTRDCTNPVPQYLGADCSVVGSSSDSTSCNTGINCPIDGGYTSWSGWSSCTVTCGSGPITRTRSCTNPTPQYLGADCVGDDSETSSCTNPNPCDADGEWSDWQSWMSCTATCGTGRTMRVRTCDNPAPMGAGISCVGDALEVESCNTQTCSNTGGANGTSMNGFTNSICPNNYFPCKAGSITCIQDVFVCDCLSDCDDQSDETPAWALCNAFCENSASAMEKTLFLVLLMLQTVYHLLQ